MAEIAEADLRKVLFALLRETFEGPSGNIYLARDAGLFATLDAVTAETASFVPSAGAQTIAAHCRHLAFYVRVNHQSVLGHDQQYDWPGSWRPQQVGEASWEELKRHVRTEYEALIATLERLQSWSAFQAGDCMAIVAHTAYHLGVIRHILKKAEPREPVNRPS